jgi:predicted nucleic-acid-binding Zn-ribbon protein
MKASGVCPKCHHNQLLHVTQVADRVGEIGGGAIDHGTDQTPEVGQFYPWRIARQRNPRRGMFVSDVMAAGLVEAFICRRCGLTELYTRDASELEADGELVREVSGPPRQGPFR